MDTSKLLRFCQIYDIQPKSIIFEPNRSSKIVINTHNDGKHIIYPSISRWIHVKHHHMKPLFRSVIECTGTIESGPIEVSNVNIILSQFLTLQSVFTEPNYFKQVLKNNDHSIRCTMHMRDQSPVEQVLIDNSLLRIYNIIRY